MWFLRSKRRILNAILLLIFSNFLCFLYSKHLIKTAIWISSQSVAPYTVKTWEKCHLLQVIKFEKLTWTGTHNKEKKDRRIKGTRKDRERESKDGWKTKKGGNNVRNCTIFDPTSCTINNKLPFVTYDPPTCFDPHKVIISEVYKKGIQV